MTAVQFDEALLKMIGGFVTTLAAILVLRRFLLPQLLTMLGLSNQRKALGEKNQN